MYVISLEKKAWELGRGLAGGVKFSEPAGAIEEADLPTGIRDRQVKSQTDLPSTGRCSENLCPALTDFAFNHLRSRSSPPAKAAGYVSITRQRKDAVYILGPR